MKRRHDRKRYHRKRHAPIGPRENDVTMEAGTVAGQPVLRLQHRDGRVLDLLCDPAIFATLVNGELTRDTTRNLAQSILRATRALRTPRT